MTILAQTKDYLVEFEATILTISRYTDGHCIALKFQGIAGQFRDSMKTHGAERAIATFLRLDPKATWQPLYKPHRMPR